MADDSLRVNVTEGMGEDVSDIDIPSVQGGLIAVTPDGILGWAWDSCNPSVPVLVTISAGGNTLGSGVADILDNEIVRQRVGVGIPAFLIKPITVPRSNYPIELDLIGESGRTLGSSLSVSGSQVLWDLLPADGSPYDGHVDAIQDGYLIGWAWDPNDPDREVILELFEGGELLGRAPASDYRADLADAGKRGGHCVFRFELPLSLFDDRCHSLTVRVANTQFQLPGKVLNFGPLGASGLLDELSFLRAEVARLRKLVERVSSPHGELQTTLDAAPFRTCVCRSGSAARCGRKRVGRPKGARV